MRDDTYHFIVQGRTIGNILWRLSMKVELLLIKANILNAAFIGSNLKVFLKVLVCLSYLRERKNILVKKFLTENVGFNSGYDYTSSSLLL